MANTRRGSRRHKKEIDDALQCGMVALAEELVIAGIPDATAWRAADRAMEAATASLERELCEAV